MNQLLLTWSILSRSKSYSCLIQNYDHVHPSLSALATSASIASNRTRWKAIRYIRCRGKEKEEEERKKGKWKNKRRRIGLEGWENIAQIPTVLVTEEAHYRKDWSLLVFTKNDCWWWTVQQKGTQENNFCKQKMYRKQVMSTDGELFLVKTSVSVYVLTIALERSDVYHKVKQEDFNR